MENSSLEDLIDRIYVKIELLESRITLITRGEDRIVMQVLDLLNQVYDLLAELRRSVKSRCI